EGFAEAPTFRGHMKYEGSFFDQKGDDLLSALGGEEEFGHELDIRAITEKGVGPVTFDLHGEALGNGGERFETLRHASVLRSERGPFLIEDRRRLFDLTKEVISDDELSLTTRIDRASVTYAKGDVVVRVGRQALTWGNGLLFQTLDLFNPFSPTQ